MKKFFKYANKKLEHVKFANKTKVLIFTIFGGTIFIGFLMFVSIFALKYDFEVLFENHTKPLVKLEEIKDIYQVNIKETLNAIKQNQITKPEGIEVLSLANQLIKKQWREYKNTTNKKVGGLPEFASKWLNFFLSNNDVLKQGVFEKRVMQNIEKKISNINQKTEKLISTLKKKEKTDKKLINDTILETNSISIYLSTLITNNLIRAISRKNANDKLFNTSFVMLMILLSSAFAFIILVSVVIVNNFKELHYSLEQNVLKKTKELRMLNNSLEDRVKKEVEDSRKKDNIMFQQARLASMGEVLHNIAHQWRQPLGALMMIIQSFESKYSVGKLDGNFIQSRVQDALKLGGNMSDTIDDFRNFFMPNRVKQVFDIKKAIYKAIELSKYQLEKEKIELIFVESSPIKIYGFKNELIHVVLNLINNCKDVLASKKDLKDKKILIIMKQTKRSANINIIDNGGGIKDDIITRIFDPYFTTKHNGVGTGIGLYMSKQLVERHMNGKIYCKNIKHKFGQNKFFNSALFGVELPIVQMRGES
ncbi:MAG: HAMP domain-containing histidine kinase [Campylobacteraceae bacterium]|nr:HAMP domain-containing histidine kinase [Campylobacteraceae bacterium]